MRIVFWTIALLAFFAALFLWMLFVSLTWIHRPIPMREIIREMIDELLHGSGKERK